MPVKKKKSSSFLKHAVVTTVVTAGSAFWLIKSGNIKFTIPAYQAEIIIDGDTFHTKEKQMIRLGSVEAPELELCGGQEAKAELERILKNQPIYLKVIRRDPYNRLISYVYTRDGSVNQMMLEKGLAYYKTGDVSHPELKDANNRAREKKLGIFSSRCTQETNPDNPKCNIKGNQRETGAKVYRSPGCGLYEETSLQLYQGDRWFCTEKDAQSAGFTRAHDCGDKKRK